MRLAASFVAAACAAPALGQTFTIVAQHRSIAVEAMASDFDGMATESDFVESEELFNFNENLFVEAELGAASGVASGSQTSLLDPSFIEVTADLFAEAIAEGQEADALATVEMLGSLTFSVEEAFTVAVSGVLSLEGGAGAEMTVELIGPDGSLLLVGVGSGETAMIDEWIDLVPGTYTLLNEHLAEALPAEEAITGEAVVSLAIATECFADINGDGELNILDFVAFQALFVSGDPVADCNGDGELNVLDFVCYQGIFQDGCG